MTTTTIDETRRYTNGDAMSTTTMYLPRKHTATSTPRTPQPTQQAIRLGTYADGQRAVAVTVTYSPRVGSWGDVDRR